jgi:hypothetical protein
MNKFHQFLIKHEKRLKYSLIVTGVLFIFIGIFVDFSWLKAIGDSYAEDGDCRNCKIFDGFLLMFYFLISGSVIIIFAIKYLKQLLNRTNDLKTILELAVFCILALYLMSSQIRGFDNDEYEHLHRAWLMIEETIPYFDIAFIHMPLVNWIIVLFVQFTGESTIIVQIMRLFMFFVSCASLFLVYIITKELFNSRTKALLGILLVISNQVWITKSPEIRPDNIMIFFALLSFWILIQYYKKPKPKYLIMFALCAVLSMLGKQNAAIFYFAIGIVFGYDAILKKKLLNTKTIIFVIIIVIISYNIDGIREFFIMNIQRHIVPNDNKFWPNNDLVKVWQFNPAVFLLFIFQLFCPIKLNTKYEMFSKYLNSVSFTCFTFLFLMNRPFYQEMLVMVVFMSMIGSNIFAEIIHKINWKVGYVITVLLIMPALISTKYAVLNNPFTSDIWTTKTILEISERDDLVFDSYGKAIFRHHPLEPRYLIYSPGKFDRLDKVKKSKVKYLIKDKLYYPKLPVESLNWFEKNFTQTSENPNIYVRINYAN